jgi:ABC-2 type transport system permease protein
MGLDRLGYTGLVARREIRERLRGRTFRVITLLLMAAIAAAVVIPSLNRNSSQTESVGVVGPLPAAVRAELVATGHSLGVVVKFRPEADAAAADSDLRHGHIDLAISGTQLTTHEPVSDTGTSDSDVFAKVTASSLGAARAFQAAGLSPAQAAVLARTQPVPIRSLESSGRSATVTGTSVIGVILTFILLTQYLTWTLMGVMEEKASRVVEVLLAAVRPVQLLAGKLLGIGVLALGQAGVLVAEALLLSKTVGSDLLHGAGTSAIITSLVWLVLGYAFYSWVYAAAGSLVERQDQVQSMALPLAAPMVFGYVVSITAASSGHASSLFRVLAYLPPTAPFAAPTLAGLGKLNAFQMGVSAAISLAATVVVAQLAARVYRRAVLRTGRAVRWRELYQLLRVG